MPAAIAALPEALRDRLEVQQQTRKESLEIARQIYADANVKADSYRDCDWEVAERLKKVAAGRNCSPAQAALAWMLSKPYMASPIIGATSLDQLTSAAQATEVTLSADDIKSLEEPYQFRVPPAA